MDSVIHAKHLLASLPTIVERVRRGTRYTVLHRGRSAFRIVPVAEHQQASISLERDSLYGAGAVARSRVRGRAADHDEVLYGR